ncbi:helix-turn-helix domain-containing protein [uncultured Oscillibacter sp.]|jgi:transcriptional regulator with XRE-family HTH domain|uniref:helix-turn-helix domain-containing protein n=1 Tax=uncultured Oscillibacter sp. TaxID=876091 RepID=UPI0025FD324F|nr:helix-turn-helix transcriptional regulator [uncultured Oscillibacter sp.]
MKFHEYLFTLREKNGLTQEAAAAGAGLSLRAYQNYERGLREPKMSTLIALADFYGITIDDLVCHSQPGK